jgi:hypothetical protein
VAGDSPLVCNPIIFVVSRLRPPLCHLEQPAPHLAVRHDHGNLMPLHVPGGYVHNRELKLVPCGCNVVGVYVHEAAAFGHSVTASRKHSAMNAIAAS